MGPSSTKGATIARRRRPAISNARAELDRSTDCRGGAGSRAGHAGAMTTLAAMNKCLALSNKSLDLGKVQSNGTTRHLVVRVRTSLRNDRD
jgi:hypothetical protein